MRRRLLLPAAAAAGLALAAVLIASGAGLAQAGGNGNGRLGKGKGREKVTLCHRGKVTIRVGAPAARAHLRHGDTRGPCAEQRRPAPPGTARLTVVKRVVNDHGGKKAPADFTLTIGGITAAGGNSFPGSDHGVTKILLTTGAYSVTEASVPGYAVRRMSEGCRGTIRPGEHRVCVIVNDDLAARLVVFKQVVNDSGGTKTPADFTITITGVAATGGNIFAGSSAGVARTLLSVGAYSVTEASVAGYALSSASAGCSGTIALGEEKTCVLVNGDVP